ncbi:MAG: SHOCT domain-containing protein [Burkholderiales bacterium]
MDISTHFFIVFLVFIFRRAGSLCNKDETHGERAESSREVLDRRYARGEIDQAEYQRIKKDIS